MITNGNARHEFLFPPALARNSPPPVTHLNCSRRLTHLSSWTHLTRTHVHTLTTARNFAISTLHPPTMISMISSVSQLRHLHNHQRSQTPCRQQLVALLLVVPPNNDHQSPRLRQHHRCLLVVTPANDNQPNPSRDYLDYSLMNSSQDSYIFLRLTAWCSVSSSSIIHFSVGLLEMAEYSTIVCHVCDVNLLKFHYNILTLSDCLDS